MGGVSIPFAGFHGHKSVMLQVARPLILPISALH